MRPTTIARLLRGYLDADYRWELDGSWHHLRVGEPAPDAESSFPDATRFGLVTAWNPQSVKRAERENKAADEALHFWLANSGLAFRPAFASAQDRGWREPGWLVAGMPVETFDALGLRFGQLATLWWQRGEPVRLRMQAHCPDSCGDDAHVDWLK